MANPKAEIRQAIDLHRQGRRAESEQLLRKVISKQPSDADAHYHLACLRAESGAFAEAVYFAETALALNSQMAAAHGLIGRLHLESRDPERALESFSKALAVNPEDAESLFGCGIALRRLKRDGEALACYESALRVSPQHPELLCNYGNVLQDLGRYEEALASFDRALQVSPGVPLLHYNRGNTLMAMGRFGEAVAAFDGLLRLAPGHAEAWNNRGNALLELGQVQDALDSFAKALVIDPQFFDALVNRGQALLELDQPSAAADVLSAAIKLEPDDATAHNALGMALQRNGLYDAAHRSFARALELEPGFAEAAHNDALLRLFEQDFAGAWTGYEARLQIPSYRQHLRKDPRSVDAFERIPRWAGPGTDPGVVGIWAEQGIGDQILFSTVLPQLQDTGQPFVYEVDQRLLAAYQRAFPAVNFIALSDPPNDALIRADAALFAGSLPGFFRRTVESFDLRPKAMLSALPALAAHYAGVIGKGLKVALSWRSLRAGWVGASKSVHLAEFGPLFRVPGIQWVDVQYGDTVAERAALLREQSVNLLHFDDIDYRNDLEDILAILAACDLLITTSNASAHLAGIIGKPVWLMYPGERPPFHYWAHSGNHRSLWHPSIELLSSADSPDWAAVTEQVAKRLRLEFT